jgi:hypothetical protein
MIGWDYGEPIDFLESIIRDTETNHMVWITDICLPTEVMLRLKGLEHVHVMWIDHHKSSILESQEKGFDCFDGLRRDGTAACRLVWECMGEPEPPVITLLGRHDVFDKTGNWEETQSFQQTVFGASNEPNWSWDEFLAWDETSIEAAIKVGGSILAHVRATNTAFKDTCFPVEFGGYRFIARNAGAGSINFCWVTDEIRKSEKYDGMMVFKYIPKLGGWRFSMYGWDDSPDFSVLAKKMDGGGHAHACGYQVDAWTMDRIITGKLV